MNPESQAVQAAPPPVEALVELADHHARLAEHFAPFGPENAITKFHAKAASDIRAALDHMEDVIAMIRQQDKP